MTKTSSLNKLNGSAAPKRRRKAVALDKKKAKSGWLFVLPFVIAFALIYLPIILDSVRFSFCSIKTLTGGGYKLSFVGWENYRAAVFNNKEFLTTLLSGIKQLCLDIPAIVIFSLFMAVLLNEKMLDRAVFRAIFFIPVILCTGLIDQLDAENGLNSIMGDTTTGIDDGTGNNAVNEVISLSDISWLFESMQIGGGLVEYVTGLINNILDIVNRSGVQMLIFLAGLQSISPAIYESCSIDGASAWEVFWKITLPMISPMILVNTIYTVIDSFTSSSNVVMKMINSTYSSGGTGQVYSSAMAWVYFLVVLGIVGLVSALLSAYIFYQRRDS